MSESTAFPDFIRRIRAGDDQAARELVERYEPVIRREVKMRLRDPRLYRRLDWADICQSVLASFFVRAASGQYELDQPEQLLRLLVVMTRHKLSTQERRHGAGKRDYRLADDRDPTDLEGRPGGVVHRDLPPANVLMADDGTPKVTTGRYMTVWKKQPDGSWMVALDASNNEPPKKEDCCKLP